MPQFFQNKRLIILLVGIIILVALIGFSLREREELTWPEQFIKDTAGFVQIVFAKPAHFIEEIVVDARDLINTYEENKRLKSHLDNYAQLKVENDRLKKENEELKAILGVTEDLAAMTPRQAMVIARSPDRWNEMLRIDKGEVHGIKKNMAVVTADGMIGKIHNVGKITADVQLLTTDDRTNRIHVAIQGEQDVYGLIEGYDEETQTLLIKQIPSDKKVEVGQDVITSGKGGVYPKGLYIGKIEKIEPDQYGLTQTAYVKPAADFYNVEHVLVIQRDATQPEDFSELEETEE